MTVGLWIFPRAVTCLECGHLHVAGEITHTVTRPSDDPLPCAVCNDCHTPAHLWLVHEHEPFPDYVLPGGNPVVASLEPRVRERVEACAVAVLEFKHSGDPLWVRRAKRIGNYVRALDSAWVSGNVTALLDLLESPPSSVRRALNLKPRPV